MARGECGETDIESGRLSSLLQKSKRKCGEKLPSIPPQGPHVTRAPALCLSGLITAGAGVSNRKRFPPLHHAVTRLFQRLGRGLCRKKIHPPPLLWPLPAPSHVLHFVLQEQRFGARMPLLRLNEGFPPYPHIRGKMPLLRLDGWFCLFSSSPPFPCGFFSCHSGLPGIGVPL